VGNYFYNGDEGQLSLQIGSSRQVESSDSGADVFQLVRNGNGIFSVDANSTNGGAAKISTGSVVSPGVYQAQDFSIVFDEVTPVTTPSTFTYSIFNNTTGSATPVTGPTTYNDGGVIAFNGVEVEISGPPTDRDVFTVNASRNQDIFTSLNNLVTSLNTPGTGNVRGVIGGDFVNSGFDATETVTFDITFDGVVIPVSTGVIAGAPTNGQIAQDMLNSIGTFAGSGSLTAATTNTDGSVTIANTTGKDVTFSVLNGTIEFITTGGTSTDLNSVQTGNLGDTIGTDAVVSITGSGNSVTTQTTISASLSDSASILAGVPQTAQLSQQIDNALNNIDRAMERIINVQTKIGGRINSIESQISDNDAKEFFLTSVRSDIEDLDFAEAISNFTFQTTALQVAQQTFVRVQGLNLFDLI